MTKKANKILIYGYGNPGRQDDGLGILAVDNLSCWVKKNRFYNIDFDSNYQLNIEDSLEISKYNVVIFIDSGKSIIKSYNLIKISPLKKDFYTSHKMSPESILFLSKELYGKEPETYLLLIKGYKWDINKKPTKKAIKNLYMALKHIKKFIEKIIK